MPNPVDAIGYGLVVSCQASGENPLRGATTMAVMAQAAERGGAVGIRAEGNTDVAAIRKATDLTIIGLRKVGRRHGVFITPTFEHAADLVDAGASIIATDGTSRPRSDGHRLDELIGRIHDELGVPVMADIDTPQTARYALAAGADLVATTLSGYTGRGAPAQRPDLDLVEELARSSERPVVAEGRFRCPDQVREAFRRGAYAVVVGTAITNPMAITARFNLATPIRSHGGMS